MCTYNEDIRWKSSAVESRFGKAPFYENFKNFSFEDIYNNAGIEKIVCSDFRPVEKKWSKKYGKSFGEKA